MYYAGCHARGGDYAWLRDNLASAPGAPRPGAITAAWAFDGRWNPRTGEHAAAATAATADPDSTADKMLVYQRAIGGWPKAVQEHKVNYAAPLPAALREATRADNNRPDATIDNNATTREIRYLVAAAARTTTPPTSRPRARRALPLQMQQPAAASRSTTPTAASTAPRLPTTTTPW